MKFHYLKASLKFPASQVVQSLELSNDNYLVAFNSLLERQCGRKHNTLLHLPNRNVGSSQQSNVCLDSQPSISETIVNHVVSHSQQVMLPTAAVKLRDKLGRFHICRALLDSGSQSHFISEEICGMLGLDKSQLSLSVKGINGMITNITHKVDVKVRSAHDNSYETNLSCIVIPKITGDIPSASLEWSKLSIPPNIKLADSKCNQSQKIDLLLGAQIFFDIMCIGQIKLNCGLTLQKTKFGWVLAGSSNWNVNSNNIHCNVSAVENCIVQNQLAKFWELEECQIKPSLSKEEKHC
ncbi:hypothetical protein FQR65_LT14295 [Abscondita terminalis]|nr:hypothetical protein FQR65_LT14295 [Abscondita terminalis]